MNGIPYLDELGADLKAMCTMPRKRSRPAVVAAASFVVTLIAFVAFIAPERDQPPGDALRTDLVVFLDVHVSPGQLAAVRQALVGHADVDGIAYFDQHDAFEEAMRLFADEPEAVFRRLTLGAQAARAG